MSFDFPTGTGSEIHLVVYVPTTKNATEKISLAEEKKRIAETEKILSTLFGGTTAVLGKGAWISDTEGLITENVIKIETFTDSSTYQKNDLKLKDWLMSKKMVWGQQAIAYEFEETLYFI